VQQLIGLDAVGGHHDQQAEGEQGHGPARAGPCAAGSDQEKAEEQQQVPDGVADVDDLCGEGLVARQAERAEHEAPGERKGGHHDHQPVERDARAGGGRQPPGGQTQHARQEQGVGKQVEGVGGGRRGRVGSVRQPVAGDVHLTGGVCEHAQAAEEGGPGKRGAGAPQRQKTEDTAQDAAHGLDQVIYAYEGRTRDRPQQDPRRQQPVHEQCQGQAVPEREARPPAGCVWGLFQSLGVRPPTSGGRFLASHGHSPARHTFQYGIFSGAF